MHTGVGGVARERKHTDEPGGMHVLGLLCAAEKYSFCSFQSLKVSVFPYKLRGNESFSLPV